MDQSRDELIAFLTKLEERTGKICQAKITVGRRTHRIGYLKDRILMVRDATPQFRSLNGSWKNLAEIHQAIQIQKLKELIKCGWVPIDTKDHRVGTRKTDGIWKFLECPKCGEWEQNKITSEIPKYWACMGCGNAACGPYYGVWASLEVDLHKQPYQIVRCEDPSFDEVADDHGAPAGALQYMTIDAKKIKTLAKSVKIKYPIAYIDIMPVGMVVSGQREPLKTPRAYDWDLPPAVEPKLAASPRFVMPEKKPYDPSKVGVYMLPGPTAVEPTYKTPVKVADYGEPPAKLPPRPMYRAPTLKSEAKNETNKQEVKNEKTKLEPNGQADLSHMGAHARSLLNVPVNISTSTEQWEKASRELPPDPPSGLVLKPSLKAGPKPPSPEQPKTYKTLRFADHEVVDKLQIVDADKITKPAVKPSGPVKPNPNPNPNTVRDGSLVAARVKQWTEFASPEAKKTSAFRPKPEKKGMLGLF